MEGSLLLEPIYRTTAELCRGFPESRSLHAPNGGGWAARICRQPYARCRGSDSASRLRSEGGDRTKKERRRRQGNRELFAGGRSIGSALNSIQDGIVGRGDGKIAAIRCESRRKFGGDPEARSGGANDTENKNDAGVRQFSRRFYRRDQEQLETGEFARRGVSGGQKFPRRRGCGNSRDPEITRTHLLNGLAQFRSVLRVYIPLCWAFS